MNKKPSVSLILLTLISSINSFTFFTAVKNNQSDLFIIANDGSYLYNLTNQPPSNLNKFSENLSNLDSIQIKEYTSDEDAFIIAQSGKNLTLYEQKKPNSNYYYDIFYNITFEYNIASLIVYDYSNWWGYKFYYIINYIDSNGYLIFEKKYISNEDRDPPKYSKKK